MTEKEEPEGKKKKKKSEKVSKLENSEKMSEVEESEKKSEEEEDEKKSETVKLLRSIVRHGHRTDVRAVAFSSDNTAFATVSGDSVKLWNRYFVTFQFGGFQILHNAL